jgi:outer membrane lipoprotein carrier protein
MALILALIWCMPVTAQDIADSIQEQYTEVNSFETEFSQKLTNAASGETEQREGTICYLKPEKIRWHTTSPEEELLISNNNVVWDYFPQEGVVYKYSLKGRFDSKTMLEFITGEVNLKEDFRIENQGQDPDFSDWIQVELVPKDPEPSLVKARIWLEPESHLIQQVMLVDFFGNKNQLTFEDIDLNVELEESLFEFDPPEGVEIMQGQ